MEDAHIALVKVPQGRAPSSAQIGAARIGMPDQSGKPPLGTTSANNSSSAIGPRTGVRGRAGTFSAGDGGGGLYPPRQDANGMEGVGAQEGTGESSSGGAGGEDGVGAAAAGWKAVDLLEDASLFGVFDGHGGKAVADFCRERLPGTFLLPDFTVDNVVLDLPMVLPGWELVILWVD